MIAERGQKELPLDEECARRRAAADAVAVIAAVAAAERAAAVERFQKEVLLEEQRTRRSPAEEAATAAAVAVAVAVVAAAAAAEQAAVKRFRREVLLEEQRTRRRAAAEAAITAAITATLAQFGRSRCDLPNWAIWCQHHVCTATITLVPCEIRDQEATPIHKVPFQAAIATLQRAPKLHKLQIIVQPGSQLGNTGAHAVGTLCVVVRKNPE